VLIDDVSCNQARRNTVHGYQPLGELDGQSFRRADDPAFAAL